MADNTQLNPGALGDTIRTIAKTENGSAKTQVFVPDVGGGGDASPEIAWQTVQGDAQPASAGIPPDAPMLWNGTTFDRLREGAAIGAALVSPVDNVTGIATITAIGVVLGFPISTAGLSKLYVNFTAATSFLGTVNWQGSNDGTTWTPIYAGNLTASQLAYGPAQSTNNPVAGLVFEVPLTHIFVRLYCSAYTSGSVTVEWAGKAAGTYKTVADQGAPGALNGGWYQRITDGAGAAVAAVKAASTAATATDPALVVALSPNSPLPDNVQGASGTNSGGAAPGVVGNIIGPLSTTGFGTLYVLCSTTGGGSLTFYGSNDNWATQWPIFASRRDSNGIWSASTAASPAAGQIWEVPLVTAQIKVVGTVATGNFQWVLKANGPSRLIVEQGVSNSASVAWLTAGVVNSVSTTNGLTQLASAIAPATPAATPIKGGAGRLYMLDVGNSGASDVWVKLFNVVSGSVTLGTTSATTNLYVPKGTRQTFGIADIGDYFSTAITYAVTGGISLTDNTAITAGAVSVNARYV
jgi:hypothetical protein